MAVGDFLYEYIIQDFYAAGKRGERKNAGLGGMFFAALNANDL